MLEEREAQRACVSNFLHKARTVYTQKNSHGVLVASVECATPITRTFTNVQARVAPQGTKYFACA